MPARHKPSDSQIPTAKLRSEDRFWLAADRPNTTETAEGNGCNHTDAAEPKRSGDSQPEAACRACGARQYKHVVLDFIFLSRAERDRSRASVNRRTSTGPRANFISNTFDEEMPRLAAERHLKFAESAKLKQAINGNLTAYLAKL